VKMKTTQIYLFIYLQSWY